MLCIEFQVSTFGSFGSSKNAFWAFDAKGVASADPSDASVVVAMAGAASVIDHIDFSKIDGVALVSSFCSPAQYTVGGPVNVTLPRSVAGTYEAAYLFRECPSPTLPGPGPSG